MKTLYVLADPVTFAVRYAGATKRPLAMRMSSHVADAKRLKMPVSQWIRGLIASGLRPVILGLGQPTCAWQDEERRMISELRDAGADLLNVTLGGLGMLGVTQSSETQALRSASLRKHYEDPEKLAARRELGRRLGTGPAARLAGARTARELWSDPVRSAVARAKMSEAKKRALADPMAREAFIARMKLAKAKKVPSC